MHLKGGYLSLNMSSPYHFFTISFVSYANEQAAKIISSFLMAVITLVFWVPNAHAVKVGSHQKVTFYASCRIYGDGAHIQFI